MKELTTTTLYNGNYNGEKCPNCGRQRIMIVQDGKRQCEKCQWCIEDNNYRCENIFEEEEQ